MIIEELTIAEAASRLRVTPTTVRRRIRKGTLLGLQRKTPDGFKWFVQVDDDDFLTWHVPLPIPDDWVDGAAQKTP